MKSKKAKNECTFSDFLFVLGRLFLYLLYAIVFNITESSFPFLYLVVRFFDIWLFHNYFFFPEPVLLPEDFLDELFLFPHAIMLKF